MKPQHEFTAERPLAQHVGLSRQQREAETADPATALAGLARRVALALPEALALLGGEAIPEVAVSEPREGVMRELLSRSAGLCVHGLVATTGRAPALLVSVDAAGVFQLVDMAFGGEGKAPDPVPEKLPLSAQIVAARIEAEIAGQVARLAGLPAEEEQPALVPLRRDTDIAALRPFAADRQLWQVGLDIAYPGCETWSVRLTMAAEDVATMCKDEIEPTQPVRTPGTHSAPANPAARPFGDIPLPLRATIVDMRVPLSRMAALRPGDILPVSVARRVPLAIGSTTVAHGTVGEMDDRLALQIIQAFSKEETNS